jgi:DNA-binding winged helix-turn-helix (wHTH) protein
MPADDNSLRFGNYLIHSARGLSLQGRRLRVTPKSLKLLWELARRSGEVVTKEELFETVWPGVVVSDAALSSCVRELRRVLEDNARQPRYLETVHRVGFRFLPDCVQESRDDVSGTQSADLAVPAGLEAEFSRLLDIWRQAGREGPRVAVLRGAHGAGQRILGRSLLAAAEASGKWQSAVGEVAGLGAPGAAYQSLLQALEGLCLRPRGAANIADLRRLAPSWLAELPTLLGPEELNALRKRTSGATTLRLQRELQALFRSLGRRQPVLLLLEGFEHADAYTLDSLISLSTSSDIALMVVATLEPVDVGSAAGRQVCIPQSLAAAGTVLDFDLPGPSTCADTSSRESLTQSSSPVGQVCADVLLGMYCAGAPCSPSLLAAVLDISIADARTAFEQLVCAGYLERVPQRPGLGRETEEVRYRLVAPAPEFPVSVQSTAGRRATLHRRLAGCLERTASLWQEADAALVAEHYSRAHQSVKALDWRVAAAALNARRGAHRLSLEHLTRGRVSLDALAGDEREGREVVLSLAAARAHIALEGIRSASAEREYRRVHRMQAGLASAKSRFECLWELWVYFLNTAPLAETAAIAAELETLAEELESPDLKIHAHHARWGTAFMQGDLASVIRHTRQGMALCGDSVLEGIAMTRGCTPLDAHVVNHQTAVCAGFFRAWAAGLMGNHEECRVSLDAGISHARDVGHPYSLALTLTMSAAALCAAGDAIHARRYAEEGEELAREQGFGILLAWAQVYRGWAEARCGNVAAGLALMREGLSMCEHSDLQLFRPFQYALHVDTLLGCGRYEDAAYSLQEAFELARRSGDRVAWAELQRLRGELTMAMAVSGDYLVQAERDLHRALDYAMGQQAQLLVERAHASLERLRGRPGLGGVRSLGGLGADES